MSCTIFTFYSMIAFFASVTMPDTLVSVYIPEGASLFYLCHVSIIPNFLLFVKHPAEKSNLAFRFWRPKSSQRAGSVYFFIYSLGKKTGYKTQDKKTNNKYNKRIENKLVLRIETHALIIPLLCRHGLFAVPSICRHCGGRQ